MKKTTAWTIVSLLALCIYLSSCSVVAGIFKLGMGFGIFLVLLVIALIVFFVAKVGKGK